MSNYATASNLKRPTGIGTLQCAKQIDLSSLKMNIDKLDIGKLETTPKDLSKISNVINNEVVKKIV